VASAVALVGVVSAKEGGHDHFVSPQHDRGVGRIDGDEFELLKVIDMNRHGHRAPNAPFWNLCPKEAGNKDRFGTGPEDLTSVGFDEEFRNGVYLRDMYPDVVGAEYDRTQSFAQAAGEPRTLQSCLAIVNGAFPATKRTPSAGLPHHPNLVPVYSASQPTEFWLNDIPCKKKTALDVARFIKGEGVQIYAENKALIERIFDMCGTTKEAAEAVSLDLLIKLVVDGIIFEHDFGISPLGGRISDRDFAQLRNLSNAFLFGKLYGTDEQRTFTAAEFPHFLVKHFDFFEGRGIKNTWKDNQVQAIRTPLNIFVCHREEIYGLAFFFDWRYHAKDMAPGEVPAGTSFVYEYLRHKKTKELFLRTKMWNPREGEIPVTAPACKRKHMCSEEELTAIYNKRISRTGRWDTLCEFPRPDQWMQP
jgi:hypothetical protein